MGNGNLLVVNSIADWSVNEQCYGMYRALKRSNFFNAVHMFDWANLRKMASDDVCTRILHSYLCDLKNAYTHVLFVNCYELPEYCLSSIHPWIHKMVWSVDDPWSAKGWAWRKEMYNTIFTNEESIQNYFNSRHPTLDVTYLPTCIDTGLMSQIEPYTEHVDVGFYGTLYPNRLKTLEVILDWCKRHKKSFIARGMCHWQLEDQLQQSEVGDYWAAEKMPYGKYLSYMKNSGCVINPQRDPSWDSEIRGGYSHPVTDATSPSPREMECAALRVPCITSYRDGSKELFPNSYYYNLYPDGGVQDLISRLDFIFDPDFTSGVQGNLIDCYNRSLHCSFDVRANIIIDKLRGIKNAPNS